MSHKYVYLFTEAATPCGSWRRQGREPGGNDQPGYAGAPGFTISTEACTKYYEDGRSINDEIMGRVYEALAR